MFPILLSVTLASPSLSPAPITATHWGGRGLATDYKGQAWVFVFWFFGFFFLCVWGGDNTQLGPCRQGRGKVGGRAGAGRSGWQSSRCAPRHPGSLMTLLWGSWEPQLVVL
jgi:hypothetical protein